MAIESPEPPIPPVDATPTFTEVDAPVTEADVTASAATPDIAAAVDTSAPIAADVLPPIVPLTAGPNSPAVPVVGPLLIISERVGVEEASDDGEIEIRRVSLYDVGTDKYWPAFDYRNVLPGGDSIGRSAVQPASTSLLVWSMGQVHRVALNGHSETMLFEHAEIQAIEVSPDGMHVAVLYGDGESILSVLDTVSGGEVVRVTDTDLSLKGSWRVGNWHADGTALSITGRGSGAPRTALLGLDGSIRVLPQDWSSLSPDLRYALRFGELREIGEYWVIWESWDVIDVATGELRWTIADTDGVMEASAFPGRIWLGGSQYVAFRIPLDEAFRIPSDEPRILDTATGEIRSLSLDVERALRPPALMTSATEDPYYVSPHPVSAAVEYQGRVVWQGVGRGWTQFHGLVEPLAGVALRGITPSAVTREPVPLAPPPHEGMVGPLFLYSVKGDYLTVADGAEGVEPIATRRVLAYDAGAGRTWTVFTYRELDVVQAAQDGIVAGLEKGLFYVGLDGHLVTLSDDHWPSPTSWRVSPDGRKIALALYDALVVFALPSGDVLLRVDRDDLARASGVVPWAGGPVVVLNPARNSDGTPYAWTRDSSTILLSLLDGETWIGAVTATLDGEIAFFDHFFYHPAPTPEPSRASADCPENPARSCRVLLDGAVVGEGRWPQIIGFIELD
ncbi:MAG: hypothetical protein OXG19_09415 [Chloroflexi bacterium]|nr:hypothetical protein [Chloroflexota bacterium]